MIDALKFLEDPEFHKLAPHEQFNVLRQDSAFAELTPQEQATLLNQKRSEKNPMPVGAPEPTKSFGQQALDFGKTLIGDAGDTIKSVATSFLPRETKKQGNWTDHLDRAMQMTPITAAPYNLLKDMIPGHADLMSRGVSGIKKGNPVQGSIDVGTSLIPGGPIAASAGQSIAQDNYGEGAARALEVFAPPIAKGLAKAPILKKGAYVAKEVGKDLKESAHKNIKLSPQTPSELLMSGLGGAIGYSTGHPYMGTLIGAEIGTQVPRVYNTVKSGIAKASKAYDVKKQTADNISELSKNWKEEPAASNVTELPQEKIPDSVIAARKAKEFSERVRAARENDPVVGAEREKAPVEVPKPEEHPSHKLMDQIIENEENWRVLQEESNLPSRTVELPEPKIPESVRKFREQQERLKRIEEARKNDPVDTNNKLRVKRARKEKPIEVEPEPDPLAKVKEFHRQALQDMATPKPKALTAQQQAIVEGVKDKKPTGPSVSTPIQLPEVTPPEALPSGRKPGGIQNQVEEVPPTPKDRTPVWSEVPDKVSEIKVEPPVVAPTELPSGRKVGGIQNQVNDPPVEAPAKATVQTPNTSIKTNADLKAKNPPLDESKIPESWKGNTSEGGKKKGTFSSTKARMDFYKPHVEALKAAGKRGADLTPEFWTQFENELKMKVKDEIINSAKQQGKELQTYNIDDAMKKAKSQYTFSPESRMAMKIMLEAIQD